MTNKLKITIGASVTATAEFLGWFLTLAPENQNAFVYPIISLLPPNLLAPIGIAMKFIGALSGAYTVYKAARSSPNTL